MKTKWLHKTVRRRGIRSDRLRRFFVRVDSHYQISKHIRDMCIFARHDVTQDHPFSRIDLISCRNLLIYLDLYLQKKVFPIFHYALKPNGHMVLGTSETVGTFTDLFTLIDKKNKFYQKKLAPMRFNLPMGPSHLQLEREPSKRPSDAFTGLEVQKEADRLVLSAYAPAGVVINGDMDIIQFRGHTGPFVEPAPGQASLNLLKMIRPPLLLHVRRAIDSARKSGRMVRSESVAFEVENRQTRLEIEVLPLSDSPSGLESYFLVLFREHAPVEAAAGKAPKAEKKETSALRKELEATKEYLQSIIEEQEATNEELKSANEEILSSNEELQSINEELETAKEELQSTNEELTTLNEELQNRNLELNQVNNDMSNLLSSVNVPIVMLGNDLRIRRFTPMAEKVLKLIPADVGRPFSDIKTFASLSDVEQNILEVLDSMSVMEMEVRDDSGRWYSLRIRPYRTSENKIDGAVLVFIDIDTLKAGMSQLQQAQAYAESIVQTVGIPVLVLEREGKVRTANRAYLDTFKDTATDITGRSIVDLGFGGRPIPGLREMLTRDGVWCESVRDKEVEVPDGEGHRTLLINSGLLGTEKEKRPYLLLSIEDITAWKRAEREVPRLSVELERRVQDLTVANTRLESEAAERLRVEDSLRTSVADLESFSYSVSHDLRAPLRAMQGVAEALLEDYSAVLDATGRDYAQRIVTAARRMDTLILELLNYSRLGGSGHDIHACALEQAVSEALSQMDAEVKERKARVDVGALGKVLANRTLLTTAILNLLSNAIKFTALEVAPVVSIASERRGNMVRLWVRDNGIGIDPEQQERVFRLFERLHGMEKYPGTGIGLAIVRKSVESMGGKAGVESRPGEGSRFWIDLPADPQS